MKILFVGGVDMAGRAIATRLFREGHQVCWLTREVERPLWTGKVEGKVYRQPITYTTCRQVMQGEAADCVVLLTAPSRESYLDSGRAHGVLLADLSPVLRAAASVKVGRVWLLSSEDLRDEGLLSPALEELRAAERVVTSFCQEKGMQWLILRFGCLFGEGDTERYVWRYKGTFNIPDETAATKDNGTTSNNMSLVFTGIYTEHEFTNGGGTGVKAPSKGMYIRAGGTVTEDKFFEEVYTPDTVTA